jgi:hypothetical protein
MRGKRFPLAGSQEQTSRSTKKMVMVTGKGRNVAFGELELPYAQDRLVVRHLYITRYNATAGE